MAKFKAGTPPLHVVLMIMDNYECGYARSKVLEEELVEEEEEGEVMVVVEECTDTDCQMKLKGLNETIAMGNCPLSGSNSTMMCWRYGCKPDKNVKWFASRFESMTEPAFHIYEAKIELAICVIKYVFKPYKY